MKTTKLMMNTGTNQAGEDTGNLDKNTETVARGRSVKKMFLESTCASNLIIKEVLTRVFSCKFCEIF